MRAQRDILVLRKTVLSKEQLETEMEQLEMLLHTTENVHSISIANEIIDINKYKIIEKPQKVWKLMTSSLKPFVFVSNKN